MALKRLSLTRGDSKTYTLAFKDGADAPYCLKNWVVRMTLKKHYSLPDSEASLQKTVISVADSTAGTSGIATINLDPSDTINLDAGEYDFDIICVTAANKTYTVMKGRMDVEYDVTRTAGTAGTVA
jgi:hypothetical protein